MKAVGDDHERLKRIGQTKRPQILRGNKDRQAMGLEAPELVVIDEIVELLGDGDAAPLVSSSRLQLFRSTSREVLQLDGVSLRLRGHRCCAQVEHPPFYQFLPVDYTGLDHCAALARSRVYSSFEMVPEFF